MESGFSRELFLKWCSDTKNMVIITGIYAEQFNSKNNLLFYIKQKRFIKKI